MKIVVINSLYPPYAGGGAEVVVGNLVNSLKKNHETKILTINRFEGAKSLHITKEILDDVETNRFYPLNIFSFVDIAKKNVFLRLIWHFFDVFNLHSYFVVKKFLAQEKPDLVITHNLKGLGYTVPAAIRANKIKHIHTVHDVQLITPSGLIYFGKENHWQHKIFLTQIYKFFSRILFGSPQVVVFPSDYLLQLYNKNNFFANSKNLVVPNPIPASFLENNIEKGDIGKPCQILFLGQLEDHKGIKFLVESLAGSNLDVVLSIAGGGGLFDWLAAKSSDKIKFLGKLNREQVKAALAKMDYVIVPSLCYENSPMVIYESFACGVPVIAANIGGVAELIQDGVSGFTFKPGSKDDLLAAIKKAIDNPNYIQFSKKARKTVEGCVVELYIQKLLSL